MSYSVVSTKKTTDSAKTKADKTYKKSYSSGWQKVLETLMVGSLVEETLGGIYSIKGLNETKELVTFVQGWVGVVYVKGDP